MNTRKFLLILLLALVIAALPLGAYQAHAGAGFGFSTYSSGATRQVPTYYANSPLLRKFVNELPGVPGLTPNGANNLGQYMPAAVPEKWVDGHGNTTNDDYYEIGIVEYAEKMHADLPKATTLRGYVQLETPGLKASGKSNSVPLFYPDGSPIMLKGKQAVAVDNPHYLGPIIVATRGIATRIKYTNLLPLGHYDPATGQRNGDLFLPVDETLMGAGFGPDGTNKYTQNRANIHLHGGDNPWISDGTPHQWTAPDGENTPYKVGASFQNVPDMPDPGPGSGTLYFPNGGSGRLMFYHDHTAGITRLNVYAGEAGGYLLTDPPGTGETLLPIPAAQIPLVIQEKTFVPTDIALQDARWDTPHWGQAGDLWFPHVYETNQDPTSFDGTNAVGRWDYGPWFWPVFPAPDALPTGAYGDVTTTPEAFGDTPIINGTAYPTLTVDPKAYRFRILNAANDRMLNLGLYVADPAVSVSPAGLTEVKMMAAAPPTPGVGLQPCMDAAPLNPATGLPDGCWPATWPVDGRAGGVPDPTTAGPKMIQIGSEGGLFPAAAVIPAQPTNYEYMRRSVTVLNVSDHGLFLGNAERADVVVDFSQYAGQTLILYNDAPAPVPAFDSRLDYYTGDPNQTASGGWYSTLPGYGPNTRTIMQIKVGGTVGTNGTPYNEAALITALPVAFASTQPKPVVAESVFNLALGTTYADKYAKISTGSAQQHTFDFIAGDTISYFPEGSKVPVTVSAGQLAQVPVLNKAIQELFDTRGRMNATLGVEIPFTSALTQTTIPLGYIDPATETIADGETQIWKITHNGVDTHPVHFHLVNVQLINRVGWDGTVKPPSENEAGWKETVRMNPLEDVIVAVRAKQPHLPGFGLPVSTRLLDPTQVADSFMGFTQVDPLTGNPAVVKNAVASFGWEYVWHCHILGHEESDFMRPFIFTITETLPNAPTNLGVTQGVSLTWSDNSTNEIGFRIMRAPVTGVTPGTFSEIGKALANATAYTDTAVTPGASYAYYVVAFNSLGDSAPTTTEFLAPVVGSGAPTAPTSVVATAGNAQANVSFTPPASNGGSPITLYTVTSSPGGVTQTGSASPLTVTGLTNGTTYIFTVTATNTTATGPASAPSNSVIPATVPGAPTIGTATPGNTQATVTFTPPASNGGNAITLYTVTSSPGGIVQTKSTSPLTVTGLTNGQAYTFTVTATNGINTGLPSLASNSVTPATVPGAPTIGTATAGDTTATVAFTAPVSTGGAAISLYTVTSNPGGLTGTGTVSPVSVAGLANGASYTFTVTATNVAGTGPASASSNSIIPASLPGAPIMGFATAGTGQATVNFSAPLSNGGSPVIEYIVTSSPGGLTTKGAAGPLTVTGLTNTAYTFTVTARNVMGIGAASNTSNSVTPVTVPDAPTIGTAFAGNGQATVSFTPPAYNGGRPIILYTVISNTGILANGTGSPIIVTGLANGTPYTFTVTATNAVGPGATSAPSAGVTPATVPGVPTGVSAVAGNTTAAVSFTAPTSNGGSLITSYTVTSTPGGVTAQGIASPISVSGLTNGVTYTFSVTATNAVGTGAASLTSNIVTPTSTAPAAPSGLVAIASAPSASLPTVTLTWIDRSANEAGFILERATNTSFTVGLTTFTLGANITRYIDTPPVVVLRVRYYYRIRAINVIGASANSNVVNVTPRQLPADPTNLSATGVAGTATRSSITLTWRDNATNESGFYVQRSTTATGPWARVATVAANATTYTSTGLLRNRTYWYRVQAYNADGSSGFTSVVSGTTP